MKTIHEPARDLPLLKEVDVLVVGGGTAGPAAAIAAALCVDRGLRPRKLDPGLLLDVLAGDKVKVNCPELRRQGSRLGRPGAGRPTLDPVNLGECGLCATDLGGCFPWSYGAGECIIYMVLKWWRFAWILLRAAQRGRATQQP